MADSDVLKQFVGLHHKIATIHILDGRHQAAIRTIREAARSGPRDASEALASVARAAVQSGGEAYQAQDMATALALSRAALEAAPQLPAIQEFARAMAAQMYNLAVAAFNKRDFVAASESLWAVHTLDPTLAPAADALPRALRHAAEFCLTQGSALDGLVAVERLRSLATGAPQDESLFRTIGNWLRENFATQVSGLKPGAAVVLLEHLARLDPAALDEPAMSQAIVSLTEQLAHHATTQPIEVLNAVIALHPLCPSARLSWAGATAYSQAINEARRLYVAGALLDAVALCEPAIRYRAFAPDRQLAPALTSLLYRRVEELLDNDRATALAFHARALDLIEAYRSQGLSS